MLKKGLLKQFCPDLFGKMIQKFDGHAYFLNLADKKNTN